MLNEASDPDHAWMAGDLPMMQWNCFQSREVTAVHEHMISAFCPHDLSMKGGRPPLRFRHNQVDLRSSTFNATDYGLPYGQVSLFIPPAEHSFLVQFVLAGRAHFEHQGKSFALEPGYMAVLSPNESIRQLTDAGCKHFTIKLDRKQLEDLLRADLGERMKPLIFSPDPVRLDGVAASFMHFVRSIVKEIEGSAPAYTHPRAIRTTEDMLGRLLLGAVPHNHSFDYENGKSSQAAPYYVCRAEQFIRENYAEQLSLSDLVGAAGASSRSLLEGFRRYRDATPMGYLKRYRLERSRQMLLRGEGPLTVTEVALENGFLHPGKFSQDYAARFGEAPSATLRAAGRAIR